MAFSSDPIISQLRPTAEFQAEAVAATCVDGSTATSDINRGSLYLVDYGPPSVETLASPRVHFSNVAHAKMPWEILTNDQAGTADFADEQAAIDESLGYFSLYEQITGISPHLPGAVPEANNEDGYFLNTAQPLPNTFPNQTHLPITVPQEQSEAHLEPHLEVLLEAQPEVQLEAQLEAQPEAPTEEQPLLFPLENGSASEENDYPDYLLEEPYKEEDDIDQEGGSESDRISPKGQSNDEYVSDQNEQDEDEPDEDKQGEEEENEEKGDGEKQKEARLKGRQCEKKRIKSVTNLVPSARSVQGPVTRSMSKSCDNTNSEVDQEGQTPYEDDPDPTGPRKVPITVHDTNIITGGTQISDGIKCHCGLVFGDGKSYELHKKVSHRKTVKVDSSLKCEHCSQVFRTNQNRIRHIATVHSGTLNFHCTGHETCNAKFNSKRALANHLVKVHNQPSRQSRKEKEKKKTEKSSGEEESLRAKEGNKSAEQTFFECEICGSRTKWKGNHKRHMKLAHSKTRNFNCPHCGLKFGTKHNVDIHVMTCREKA